MISIVVSTYKPDDFKRFQENVDATIGVAYEIVKIENSGIMSLAAAYNKGAAKAAFDILCFLHDDIIFETSGWGSRLIQAFRTLPDAGVIGIAGTLLKTTVISGWFQPEIGENLNRMNLQQHFKFQQREPQHYYSNPANETIAKVITVDGVFMATRKEVWATNRFDEQLITHFHGYDLDFCLTIAQHYQNYVLFDIFLHHYSEGKMSKEWVETYIRLHRKHGPFLRTLKYNYPKDMVATINNHHLAGIMLLIRQLELPAVAKMKLALKVFGLHRAEYMSPEFLKFALKKISKRS